MKSDCATSPLLVPVLFDRDSAQATQSSHFDGGGQAVLHCILELTACHVTPSIIRSILTHTLIAQAGHRYARTPLGINISDLINEIE